MAYIPFYGTLKSQSTQPVALADEIIRRDGMSRVGYSLDNLETNVGGVVEVDDMVTSYSVEIGDGNCTYRCHASALSSLTITLDAEITTYQVSKTEIMIVFDSGSTATTLTYPNSLKWDTTPAIEANKRYILCIVSGCAMLRAFE